MKHLKRLGSVGAMVMVVLGLAGPAEATQITPANTAVTFHSSNLLFSLHGGGTLRCSSTISGTTPLTSATTVSVGGTLTFVSCIANGSLPAAIDLAEACNTPIATPTLKVMGIGNNQAVGSLTIPTGCNASVTVPSIGCTVTLNGHVTGGNGTAGLGGGLFTGGATPVVHFNSALTPVVAIDGPTTAACSTSATHTATGTLTGTFVSNSTIDVDGS